jgi:hypothetical protein
MKKKLILLGFLLCFLGTVRDVRAEPFLFFDTESYDFGDTNQGDILEYTFTFTNLGTNVLTIEKVTSS